MLQPGFIEHEDDQSNKAGNESPDDYAAVPRMVDAALLECEEERNWPGHGQKPADPVNFLNVFSLESVLFRSRHCQVDHHDRSQNGRPTIAIVNKQVGKFALENLLDPEYPPPADVVHNNSTEEWAKEVSHCEH